MFKNYYEEMIAKRNKLPKDPKQIESENRLQQSKERLERAIKDMIENWKKKNYSEEALKQWK